MLGHGNTSGHLHSAQIGLSSPNQTLPNANLLSQSAYFLGNAHPSTSQTFSQNMGMPAQMGASVNGGSGVRQSPPYHYGSHMPSPTSQFNPLTSHPIEPIDVSQQSYRPQYIESTDPTPWDFNLSGKSFIEHCRALESKNLDHKSLDIQDAERNPNRTSSMILLPFGTQSYVNTRLDQVEILPFQGDGRSNAWQPNATQQSLAFGRFDSGTNARFSNTRPVPPASAIGSGQFYFPGASPSYCEEWFV